MARKGNNNERTDKKAETIKKRQDALKKKFIKTLEQQPVIQTAVAIAGIDRSTYYRWRDEDPEFREKTEGAKDQGIEFTNDMMESLLIKLAREGKITPIIFWLKNHHPDYSEKKFFNHEHHITQDDVLTEERKKEIMLCMQAWSEPEDGDERDEDYEFISEEVKKSEVKSKPKKIQKKQTRDVKPKKTVRKKAVTKKVETKPQKTSGSTVAKKIVPKKLK
jgi:hypothetical protein